MAIIIGDSSAVVWLACPKCGFALAVPAHLRRCLCPKCGKRFPPKLGRPLSVKEAMGTDDTDEAMRRYVAIKNSEFDARVRRMVSRGLVVGLGLPVVIAIIVIVAVLLTK